MQVKVKKLVEKPDRFRKAPKEKEAQIAKEIYEALNEQLTTKLFQLIGPPVPYLDPAFEALVYLAIS
ncbi:hypothetical protein BDZ91DRAFT_846606 [Kalaharituber pfeilii]|nr:hypothetical protein BDZ91DRAFT_846606 [Kalaharituber pfeilii]